MKRRVTTLLLSVMLMLVTFTSMAAGWLPEGDRWKYDNGNGTFKTSEWFTDVDGKAYYFGADSYMMVNSYTPDGYWVGPDGVWVPGQAAQAQQTVTRSSGSGAAVPANTSDGTHYVLNTNTKKFHVPGCASVADIKAGNREDRTTTRENLISAGYKPCGRCNP